MNKEAMNKYVLLSSVAVISGLCLINSYEPTQDSTPYKHINTQTSSAVENNKENPAMDDIKSGNPDRIIEIEALRHEVEELKRIIKITARNINEPSAIRQQDDKARADEQVKLAKHEEKRYTIDSKFFSEEYNPALSKENSDRITSIISSNPILSKNNVSIECRSSTCRLTMPSSTETDQSLIELSQNDLQAAGIKQIDIFNGENGGQTSAYLSTEDEHVKDITESEYSTDSASGTAIFSHIR